MKKKCKISYALLFLLTATVLMWGCQGNPNAAGSQKVSNIKEEEISYLSKPLTFPEYASLDGAYFTGDTLYYAATPFDQNRQQGETAFYTLKPDTTQPELLFTLPSPQRVQKMTMDEAGNLYYLGYEEAAQEDMQDKQSIFDRILYQVDRTGTVLLKLNLKEYMKSAGQPDVQGLAVDNKGMYLAVFTANQDIYVFDTKGKLLFETKSTSGIYDICSSNGKLWVGYESDKGIAFKELDIPNRKLSEKLGHAIPGRQCYLSADHQGGLLVATEESVYQYRVETEELIKKLDWKTFDSTGISFGMLFPYGENGILTISRNYANPSTGIEVTIFRETAEGEVVAQEKTLLTLAVDAPPRGVISERMAAFNKANPSYRIEMKNYSEDYTRLYAEIMSDSGPDIIMMSSDRINQLAESGILEDLNPYLEEEDTLNRSDFLENILNAFEIKGSLYGMPANFQINVMVGKTSLLGGKSGWNLEEFMEFTKQLPKGTDIFYDTSKSGVLHLLKLAYIDELVDAENAAHPLNRELLITMLEFANQYKDNDQYVQNTDLAGQVADGQLLLLDDYVGNGSFYRTYSQSLFGEPVTFIGHPTPKGNGNLIHSPENFAILSQSKYKDVAWDFICTLFSTETQTALGNDIWSKLSAFPIRKDAMENFYVSMKKGSWNDYARGGRFIRERHKGITEEELQPIRNLIEMADTAQKYTPNIDQIIEDESSSYFDGNKTIEETVDIIENRVRTYVNENN